MWADSLLTDTRNRSLGRRTRARLARGEEESRSLPGLMRLNPAGFTPCSSLRRETAPFQAWRQDWPYGSVADGGLCGDRRQ